MKALKLFTRLMPLLLVLCSINTHAQVTLVAMEDFPPYSWYESEKQTGIDIDIIQLLSEKTGITIHIRLVPWVRVEKEIKKGKTDGGVAFFKNTERETFATFIPTPFRESIYKIFVRKDSEFDFHSVSDLSGMKIGQNAGFYISDAFEQAVIDKKIQRVEAVTMEENIRRLRAKRIDAFVGNQQEVLYFLAQLGLSDDIVSLPKPIRPPKPVYIVISKEANLQDKEKLIIQMNKTLKEMKEEGLIDKIQAKYGQHERSH
ncbi:substrate-binding periplasmic protein [Vibrio coralliilyticus]|uniref:substrate-binding periplasmic protein n=1 Tax=Vibrio coralliilyticus TaxID=190893 RepID=UPI0017E715A8|nr:transporter substrate-binding domain-containing protein [Vibrio coralliilyticus]NUW67104.1 amino acid ABC transporter substrate-binding protein [Vibrio coralliilyticus]